MLPDSPDSPEYKLNKLLADNSSGLSTEGIIQTAERLLTGETIFCTTPITPIVKLRVDLDNEVRTKDIITVSLMVLNCDHMRHSLPFRLQPAHTLIQMARFNGRSSTDPGQLSMQDIVNTFALDNSSTPTIWHIWGYRVTTGDSSRGYHLR